MAGVAACAVLLGGCHGPWKGEPDDPSIMVYGDSLTYLSNQTLGGTETMVTDALVDAGGYASVTGVIGLSVPLAYPFVWHSPGRDGLLPDVLVVALGTNDMRIHPGMTGPLVDLEMARLRYRAWLAEVPEACVVLVGVAENVAGWGLDITGPGWNAMLAEEAALHANARYVAWEPDLAWVANGADPHLDATGRAAFRDLIVSEALDCAGL